MFTVEPAQLTVPAGGQANAAVTADTTIDAAEGEFGGLLTATGAASPCAHWSLCTARPSATT